MNEMVQRVARAIWLKLDGPELDECEEAARAAIEAMQVPTGAMIVSGAKLVPGKNYAYHAIAIYPKMIEAALK